MRGGATHALRILERFGTLGLMGQAVHSLARTVHTLEQDVKQLRRDMAALKETHSAERDREKEKVT